jgi:hypothetical protein
MQPAARVRAWLCNEHAFGVNGAACPYWEKLDTMKRRSACARCLSGHRRPPGHTSWLTPRRSGDIHTDHADGHAEQ